MMTRRWVQDLALMVGALAAQLAPFVFVSPETPGAAWSLIGYEAVVIASVPVLLRRLHPGLLLLVATLGIALYAAAGAAGTVPPQPIWYGPLICMYTVAYQSPRWQRVAALAATALGMVLVIRSYNTAIRELAMWSAAYALGALMRTRQEASAQIAAERERTRIARDLHDILGHAFSVMVVQAETGAALAKPDLAKPDLAKPDLAKPDPGRAEQAFDAIAHTGREAMAQLRGTMGDLRGPGPPRAPQPGLAELPELVRGAGSADLAIRLTETGPPRTLSAAVQLAVYRLVQEALTNVINHSRARRADVLLDWQEGAFTVSVVDDGIGKPAAASLGGHGLNGIRERVAAAGGRVEFANGAKGFHVTAVFR